MNDFVTEIEVKQVGRPSSIAKDRFGVDIKNMAGVVLPSILFSALMALGGTDK